MLSAAQNIVDELADRERRKKNVVMYDLPEAEDRVADKLSVLALLKKILKPDVLSYILVKSKFQSWP